MDDKEFRRLVDLHLLLSIDMSLALVAVPLVIPRQCLINCEIVQTIIQGYLTRLLSLEVIYLLSHCRQLPNNRTLIKVLQVGLLTLISPMNVNR